MKVWMWQRLYKWYGYDLPYDILCATEDAKIFQSSDECLAEHDCHWLCPKPNLVLVDRKHLGGME